MIANAPKRSNIIPAETPMIFGVSNTVTGIGCFVAKGVAEFVAMGVAIGVGVPGTRVPSGVGVVFETITIGVGVGLPAIMSVMVYEPVPVGVNKISVLLDF